MSVEFTKGAPTDTETKLGEWLEELQSGEPGAEALAPTLGEGYEVRYVPLESIAGAHAERSA